MLDFFKRRETIILFSLIWGFGLACLFRKVCNDRTCIIYKAPNVKYVQDNTWKYNDKCYKFNAITTKCNKNPIE